MKKLLVILFLLLPASGISKQEVKRDAWKKNMNIDNINLQHTYKLDNGKIIYIGSTGTGTWIWEKDKLTGKLNYISGMWFFYGIAKSCPDENLENVLFATQKEYYYMGGINEDPPPLRSKRRWLFSLSLSSITSTFRVASNPRASGMGWPVA